MTSFILIVLCAIVLNMACIFLKLQGGPNYKINNSLFLTSFVITFTIIIAYFRIS